MTKEKTPFYICAVRRSTLAIKNSVTILDVFLDKKDFVDPRPLDEHGMSLNPWIIALTNRRNPAKDFLIKQLNKFKKTGFAVLADETHPIRWCGSGAVLILEDDSKNKYLVVNKRHANAAWGNYFDGYGGYSSSKADMLNPVKLGLREFAEEIKFNIKHKPKIIKPDKNSKIVIHFQKRKYIYNNLNIIIDSETGTVDFRVLSLLKIKNLDNLKITDHETIFINKKSQRRQKRPVLLYDFEDINKLVSGKNRTAIPVKGYYENNVIDNKSLKEYKISLSVMTPTLLATLKNAINF